MTLFCWPTDDCLARKWTPFVRTTRKDFVQPSRWSCVCHFHFEHSVIDGWIRFRFGGSRLKLKEGAFPTIHSKRHAGNVFTGLDTPLRYA